jgi:hypothetical protein
VHLGAEDGPVADARKKLGAGKIIGVSCYDRLQNALDAQSQGADYVAFGSFFASGIKPEAVRAPLALLREAARSERWEGFGTEELGAEFTAAQDKLRGEREKEGMKRQREALLGKRLQDLTPEERRLVAAAPR